MSTGMSKAAMIGKAAMVGAITAIAAATVKATKMIVASYAQYEQLVGGVETLFKDAADDVFENAKQAFKTVGMSANEYMQTTIGFSASLLQSLGNDTKLTAEYTDLALTDMADNANKMGNSLERIKYAYLGFSRQNFMMLDNLALGYKGTTSEMQRLIKDAAKLDKSIKANDLSFANIIKAIHVVQKEIGITGTTAKEAEETIEGSMNAAKSAFKNLLTGFADEKQDIDKLVEDVYSTVDIALKNLLPRIGISIKRLYETFLENIPDMTKAIVKITKEIARGIAKELPVIMQLLVDNYFETMKYMLSPENIHDLVEIIKELAIGVIKGIIISLPTILAELPSMLIDLISGIFRSRSEFRQAGVDIIESMWEGIVEKKDEIFQKIKDMFTGIAEKIGGIFLEIWNKITGRNDKISVKPKSDGASLKMQAIRDRRQESIAEVATAGASSAGKSIGTVNINVSGAQYSNEDDLADAIAVKLQNMVDKENNVYE